MLLIRDWKLRTKRVVIDENTEIFKPQLSFKYFEKIFLFLAKHVIQSVVLFIVKVWYLIATKTKIWFQNKLPKIHNFFRKETNGTDSRKISFIQRAVIESKIKIKKVKDKIKKEHEDKIETPVETPVSEETNEVDKIL